MAEWLRPKFQRTPSGVLNEDINDNDGSDRHRTSRVTSYLGFSRPVTPQLPPTESFNSKASDSFTSRDPHLVYERPSVDHMVESLKVAMMTKDSMEPLNIVYNSSILHTLEAYSDLKAQLETKEHLIEKLKEKHTRDIRDFEEQAARYQAKENDYKTEMRKLEVLLANTEGGMEKVSMARSTSILHGAPRTDSKRRRAPDLSRADHNMNQSRRDPARSFHGKTLPPPLPLPRRNTFGIASAQEPFPRLDKTISPHLEEAIVDLGLSKAHLDTLNKEHIETDLGIAFESSESSQSMTCSRTSSFGEKPLPDLPVVTTADEKETRITINDALHSDRPPSSPWVEEGLKNEILPFEKSFSYRPGDDSLEIFTTGESARNRANGLLVKEQRHRSSMTVTNSNQKLSTTTTTSEFEDKQQRPRPMSLLPHSRSGEIRATHLRGDISNDHVKRGGSSSSVITAIRDNSGRSSVNDNQGSKSRPRLNHHSGSSEAATIAAARAIASKPVAGPADIEAARARRLRLSSDSHEEDIRKESPRASAEAQKNSAI